MSNPRLRPMLMAACLAFAGHPLVAQLPSPSDAQALLQSRPDLVNQLRQRIVTSGMTADQIRARLRSAGYPENLLDSYLPSGSGSSAMTGATGAATELDVLTAAKQLGIVDSTDIASFGVLGGGAQQANSMTVP